MSQRCRILPPGARFFYTIDPDSTSSELAVGTELEIGEPEERDGKKAVAARLLDGRTGYLAMGVKVWMIVRVTLQQSTVDVYAQADRTSGVLKKLTKGSRFLMEDLVESGDGQWIRIQDNHGESGFINSRTKVILEPVQPAKVTSFRCLIPDRPLTGGEQWSIGLTTGGAFRGIFRPAIASIENGELIIRATAESIAGESMVIAARMPVQDGTGVHVSPISMGTQLKSALFKSLVVGGGFALTIFLVLLLKSGDGRTNRFSAFAFALLFGLGMGFVLSFLPSLFKQTKPLTQLLLVAPDGQTLVMAVETARQETALKVLAATGLNVPAEPQAP